MQPVKFLHLRLRPKPKKVPPPILAKGGVTVAYEIHPTEDGKNWHVTLCTEKCSVDEHYNKKKGRAKSSGQLVRHEAAGGHPSPVPGCFTTEFTYPRVDDATDLYKIIPYIIRVAKQNWSRHFRKFELVSRREYGTAKFPKRRKSRINTAQEANA